MALCSPCGVTWFGCCQMYLAVPWQQVPSSSAVLPPCSSLQSGCGALPAGWGTPSCWLCAEKVTVGTLHAHTRHELMGSGRTKKGNAGTWNVRVVLSLDPFHRVLTLPLVASRASAAKVHLLPSKGIFFCSSQQQSR